MAGGGANWDAYNLPAIWSMIQNENACTGADRVLAWQNLATTVRDQHRRLLAARESLAAVWPPEQNTSARVFMEHLDLLAASMDQTLTYAEDTRVGLQGVITAIGAAQSTIRPLVAERAEASHDLIPRFLDNAEDEYDERARQAMRAAESAISDHSAQIQAPTLYELRPGQGDTESELPADSTSASGSGSDGSSGAGGSGLGALRATPTPVAVPHDPPAPASPADTTERPSAVGPAGSAPPGSGTAVSDQPNGAGPGLAGAVITPPGAVPGAGNGVVALQPPVGGPPVPAGGVPGAVIGGGLGLVPTIGGANGLGSAPGMNPAGYGGVGTPPGHAAATRRAVPVRRGLPSGAVIGMAGPEGRLGARPVQGRQPLAGTPGRHGRHSESSTDLRVGEADQQWGVRHGVAPVITADTTQHDHRPGPGVIGLDQ